MRTMIAFLMVAVLASCGSVRADDTGRAPSYHLALLVNGGYSPGLTAEFPSEKSMLPLPGREVFGLGVTTGEVSAGFVSVEHRFGATTRTSGYVGLGLGMTVNDIETASGLDLGLKITLGNDMNATTCVQADFYLTEPAYVMIGIGRRF